MPCTMNRIHSQPADEVSPCVNRMGEKALHHPPPPLDSLTSPPLLLPLLPGAATPSAAAGGEPERISTVRSASRIRSNTYQPTLAPCLVSFLTSPTTSTSVAHRHKSISPKPPLNSPTNLQCSSCCCRCSSWRPSASRAPPPPTTPSSPAVSSLGSVGMVC